MTSDSQTRWLNEARGNARLLTVLGIVQIIVGIFAIGAPLASGVAITMLIGAILIVAGVIRLFCAVKAGADGEVELPDALQPPPRSVRAFGVRTERVVSEFSEFLCTRVLAFRIHAAGSRQAGANRHRVSAHAGERELQPRCCEETNRRGPGWALTVNFCPVSVEH